MLNLCIRLIDQRLVVVLVLLCHVEYNLLFGQSDFLAFYLIQQVFNAVLELFSVDRVPVMHELCVHAG